jgi:hypothetical protein
MAKNGANEIDMADVTEDNIKINDSEYNELEKELRSSIRTSGSEDPCENFKKSLRKFREKQSKALAFSSSKYGEYYEAGSDKQVPFSDNLVTRKGSDVSTSQINKTFETLTTRIGNHKNKTSEFKK